MNSKKLFVLIFLTGFNLTVFSQITSFNFDPNKVNKELAHKMDSLYQEDQKYRLEWVRLIDKYGWLGHQDVGIQGT